MLNSASRRCVQPGQCKAQSLSAWRWRACKALAVFAWSIHCQLCDEYTVVWLISVSVAHTLCDKESAALKSITACLRVDSGLPSIDSWPWILSGSSPNWFPCPCIQSGCPWLIHVVCNQSGCPIFINWLKCLTFSDLVTLTFDLWPWPTDPT